MYIEASNALDFRFHQMTSRPIIITNYSERSKQSLFQRLFQCARGASCSTSTPTTIQRHLPRVEALIEYLFIADGQPALEMYRFLYNIRPRLTPLFVRGSTYYETYATQLLSLLGLEVTKRSHELRALAWAIKEPDVQALLERISQRTVKTYMMRVIALRKELKRVLMVTKTIKSAFL
jgi:hypothetical protein